MTKETADRVFGVVIGLALLSLAFIGLRPWWGKCRINPARLRPASTSAGVIA